MNCKKKLVTKKKDVNKIKEIDLLIVISSHDLSCNRNAVNMMKKNKRYVNRRRLTK